MKTLTGAFIVAALLVAAATLILPGADDPAETGVKEAPVLDSSRRTERAPLNPDDPLPPAPSASKEDVATVRQALDAIFKAENARKGICGNTYMGCGAFLIEQDYHFREFRLLTEVYPAAVEQVAEELLANPTSSRERHVGLNLLSRRAGNGSRRAELMLLQAASAKGLGRPERDAAIHALSGADPARLYQALYLRSYESGANWSRFLLDLAAEPATMARLKGVSSNPAEPDYVREDVDETLARLKILQSPDMVAQLRGLILKPHPPGGESISENEDGRRRWALSVVGDRKLDLRATLRRRLDRDFEEARATFHRYSGASFEDHFRTSVHLYPPDWDQALLTYVKIGGVPTDLERKRLQEFGYLREPRARLAELLRTLR